MQPFAMGQLRGTILPSLLSNLLLALLMVCALALLRIWGPQESLRLRASPGSPGSSAPSPPSASSAGQPPGQEPAEATAHAAPSGAGIRRFVLVGDTINGEPIADPVIVERIERVAASVPAELLAGASRAPHVRYAAHAFGASDDAPIYYGVFRDPAAALAFGCALDDIFAAACEPAPVMAIAAAYEDPPGVQCRPMRVALGTSAYEPDRCEAGS